MALEAGPGKTAMGHARVFGARVDEWTDEGERKVDSARPVLLSQRQRSQIVPMITELYIEPPTRRRRRHLHYSYTHLLLLLRCFKRFSLLASSEDPLPSYPTYCRRAALSNTPIISISRSIAQTPSSGYLYLQSILHDLQAENCTKVCCTAVDRFIPPKSSGPG
ncbi:hypothetical protein K443DRAFT_475806 [Laccaria amethystina LaAM-08-1]|uniref:Uncharacterized protein n=1 Tax=Laccaria amethystina LaAM-08-1 TaxID=1095629 RepID=A0A0C9XPD9_9AGAR|nr:hypothetical protein K443DRAFT_475806 [Laccaria amethystina LaAM-08-1]